MLIKNIQNHIVFLFLTKKYLLETQTLSIEHHHIFTSQGSEKNKLLSFDHELFAQQNDLCL